MQEKTYEKTIWEDGKTLITANLLNKVEDKLVDLDSNVKTIDSQIKDIENQIDSCFYNYFKKLCKGEHLKIVCQGDSMTYGYDVVSFDKRPIGSDRTKDSETTGSWQTCASKTYPEMLQELFSRTYTNVTILNRGYSGDSVKLGYNRWRTNPYADLHILMYGTNDGGSDGGAGLTTIEEFIDYYSNMIERIISWGSAVIILGIPRHKIGKNGKQRAMYNRIAKEIAHKYSIPYIDSMDFLSGYSDDKIMSDDLHYNGYGYSQFATRVFANISANCLNKPYKLINNFDINQNNIVNYTNLKTSDLLSAGIGACSGGVTENEGYTIQLLGGYKKIINIYNPEDANVLFFSYNCLANSKLKITVNGGLQLAKPNSTAVNKSNLSSVSYPVNTLTFGGDSQIGFYGNDFNNYRFSISDIGTKGILLPKKGVYTITLENSGTNASYLIAILSKKYSELKNSPFLRPMSFLNNWVEDTSETVRIYTDNVGIAHLEGCIKNGYCTTGSIIPIMTLPIAPQRYMRFNVNVKGNDNSYSIALVDINTNGEVRLLANGNNKEVLLNGITFLTKS